MTRAAHSSPALRWASQPDVELGTSVHVPSWRTHRRLTLSSASAKPLLHVHQLGACAEVPLSVTQTQGGPSFSAKLTLKEGSEFCPHQLCPRCPSPQCLCDTEGRDLCACAQLAHAGGDSEGKGVSGTLSQMPLLLTHLVQGLPLMATLD